MGFTHARYWTLHLIFIEFHWVSPGCTPTREWSPFSSCMLTAPPNSSPSSDLLGWCSVFQVPVNQELRVLAQVLIPATSSHTVNLYTSSLMAQRIFQKPFEPVIQSRTHQFSHKSTVGDYMRVFGKVKIYNIHEFPLAHTAIHHTLVTGATEITSM